ncbi:MAG: hypothetical protein EA397_16940 [Deltaproteobacteria bacterium]|nr:MAG: hypothetical protein EA397_16940 [Deltaproteobacteria bacterium]
MKTMNVTAALLAASLPLSTLALAQDQPDTIDTEQGSGDETQIEVVPGAEPVTVILRIKDARRERAPLNLPRLRLPKEERELRWADRDRPFVFTAGVGLQFVDGMSREKASGGLIPVVQMRLASDRYFWVAEVGAGSTLVPEIGSTHRWQRDVMLYARTGPNIPLYRGARSDTRLQPTLGFRHVQGTRGRNTGCSNIVPWVEPNCWQDSSESFSFTNLTGSLGLERTQWITPKVGVTFGASMGFMHVPGRGEDGTEIGLSVGVTL